MFDFSRPGLRVFSEFDSEMQWNPPAPTGQSVSNAYGIGSRSKCRDIAAFVHKIGDQHLRACQRHTTGLALPDRCMISSVPQPSAVARMILARQPCFCGALRSDTIASSRRRSSGVTWTVIPALIMRA